MTGQAGVSTKPFYAQVAQQFGFETEGSSYYALSGSLSSLPDFTPDYEVIKIPAHNDLGDAYDKIRGQSKHKISFPYGDLKDLRFLAHIFGGRLDQEKIIEGTGGSGTFQADEDLTGGTSGAIAVISSVNTYDLTLKVFSKGETVTGGTSSATGIVHQIKNGRLYLITVSGTFQASETITGGTSGAKAVIDTIGATLYVHSASGTFTIGETVTGGTSSATGTVHKIDTNQVIVDVDSGTFQADEVITGGTSSVTATIEEVILDNHELKKFADSETVTGGTSSATATVSDIVYEHYLFVTPDVDPKSIVYVQENIGTFQHLLTGCVGDNVEIKGAAGTAPVTGSVDYMASHYEPDDTVDSEVAFDTSLNSYQYSDVDFTINSVNYEGKAKAFTMGFQRGHGAVPTFQGDDPLGYGSGPFVSTLNFEIHQQDKALIDLMQNETNFATAVTISEVSGEREAIITYASCEVMKTPIKGDNTFLIPLDVEVNSTPTVTARDKLPSWH